MIPILVNAPLLAAASAFEEAGAATMAGTTGGAAAPVTGVVPPTAEDAGAAAAAGFAARGAETAAILTQLMAIRTLFAQTIAAGGAAYTAVDGINEALATI